MASALVVGGAGMIGQPLALALAARGLKVYATMRTHRSPDDPKVSALTAAGVALIQFDTAKADAAVLPAVDIVFLEIWDRATHGGTDPEWVWRTNFYEVGRIVERFVGVAHIVNGCTLNVYGDSEAEASEDASALRPQTEYGQARVGMESLINYFAWRGGKKALHLRYAHANKGAAGFVHRIAAKASAARSNPHPHPHTSP